jgi:hypothetical protein
MCARGFAWAKCGLVCLQANMRLAEGFLDLVDELDILGDVVIECRRLRKISRVIRVSR